MKARHLILLLLFAPLTIGHAETMTWTNPTTYTDNTTISAVDKARITTYFRGWKAGNPSAKTYWLEARGGATTITDNVMARMNQWGASVPGWIPLVPGDTVYVTISSAITWPVTIDNVTTTREFDSVESAPLAYTIPKPPPPPAPTPSCNAPTGLTIKP